MVLKYYHAEPLANSLKSMIPLFEKGLEFESVYVNLHKFEQHQPWFVAINPEGQVPVLDHDGTIITQTTVINEYYEDAFPDTPPLRPNDPVGNARMRYWNKFVDEHVMNFVSIHGWHRMAVSGAWSAPSLTSVSANGQRKPCLRADSDMKNSLDQSMALCGSATHRLSRLRL